ncbi:transposase [Nitrosomonas nitrosa]|uniref:Transposase n=1 Tax=Nitrosomonas nitrosa TaxID=52442 RepID=A0A8H9DA26_9PROT|nr:ISAzo13 family transposase [Nitrosomonas nitrosa]CAE6511936.1 transposase [Nitrosomonas nitrosa]
MIIEDDIIEPIRIRFSKLAWILDERMRRLFAAAEASALGRGGITKVAQATGVSRRAIHVGLRELSDLKEPVKNPPKRIRKEGAGRKSVIQTDVGLMSALEKLVEPMTRGDPESPLRWTCKSLRTLAGELSANGHPVSYPVVGDLLRELGYSLQANRKVLEGSDHPDRNAQFEFINEQTTQQLMAGNPVISVDTKKKELVGAYKNNGTTWCPEGKPEQVKVHDFVDKELGRANPYGVYDVGSNTGWVSVGTDHDTASFTVETIRRWWRTMGRQSYPAASELMITADGGGSNGSRVRLWKMELQRLADEIRIPIHVSHLPPGTSKWNKIEHRLFSYISMNWRGRPLISHEVIINLIAGTTTRKGLKVHAELDDSLYPAGIKVSDDEFKQIHLTRNMFHGEWNYRIDPRPIVG